MKRLGLLVSLVMLSVVGTTTTTQAYYLDTPHNESNGIYCFTCHYQLSKSLNYTGDGGDPDYTFRNAVCLMCHAAGSTHPNRGPAKVAHSSANTSIDKGTWTTECTQCHDVHFQGQLDHAVPDSAELFLATGTFDTSTSPKELKFWSVDADGGVCTNVVQPTLTPPCGTTTVGISGTITAAPDPFIDWSLTANWGKKGGLGSPGRGLVLVPNKNNPGETFEIISVTSNIIKVKGKMTTAISNGQVFGVIYGQSIKSFIMPNSGTTIKDLRDVKFFKPGLIAGGAGGYVDLTPGETEPKGLCQACHVSSINWTSDGLNTDHNPETPCGSCHILSTGGGNEVIKDHTTYIADTSVGTICLPCHAAEHGDPDSAHAAGCSTCHTMGNPTLANNDLNTIVIANEDGRTVLGSILAAGYTYSIFGDYTHPRLQDYDGTDIQLTGGDGIFDKIGCNVCHFNKTAAVTLGTHGGHTDTDFVWNGNCRTCHDPSSTLRAFKDIHGNGSQGTCTLCHSDAGIAASTYERKDGDPAYGIDGTALLMTTASSCTDCHLGVNTSGVIHHVSPSGWAAAGTCNNADCHGKTGFKGDHSPGVDTDTKCNSCHAANAATGQDGTPVDPFVATVHDSCIVCHKTNGAVRTMGEVVNPRGILVAMPALGGTCLSCHGDYFNNHTIDHATFVQNTTNCIDCHLGAEGNSNDIPTGTGPKVHTNCASCHLTTTGLLKPAGGVAQVMQGVSATCVNCHTLGFSGFHQTINHSGVVADYVNCTSCHLGAVGLINGIPVGADPKLHAACASCHSADGRLIGSATGKTGGNFGGINGGGSCFACHGEYFNTHTTNHLSRVGDTPACTICHTGVAGTAETIPLNSTNPKIHDFCADCHAATGLLKTAGQVNAARAQAMPAGNSTCVQCHTSGFDALHPSTGNHDTYVANHLDCSSCHLLAGAATDANQGLNNTTRAGRLLHDACSSCHDAATGALKGAAIGKSGANTCLGCHGNYFNNHTNDHATFVQNAPNCSDCHTVVGKILDANDATRAGRLVHDYCADCHAANGLLKSPGGVVAQANPPGGGTCETCHTSGFNVFHQTVVHNGAAPNDMVINHVNCSSSGCHTQVFPVDSGDPKVHDSCATCHLGSNGRLVNTSAMAPTMPTGGTFGGVDGGGDCTVCHGAYFDSHTAVNHDTYVSNSANCSDCHTVIGKNVDATVGLTDATRAGRMVHDTCSTCHTATGGLKSGPFTVASGNPVGGGSCMVCHNTGFLGYHQSTINHTSLIAGHVNCDYCHTGSIGLATGIPAAGAKNHTNCESCHLSTTGRLVTRIDTPAIRANTYGGNDGVNTCNTCHVDYFNYHTSNHATFVGATAACTSCHDTAAGTAGTVPTELFQGANPELHINCYSCHQVTGHLRPAPNTKGVGSMTLGANTCASCHNNFVFDNHIHTHLTHYDAVLDKSQATPTSCGAIGVGCHEPVGNLATWASIQAEHTGGCARCHNYSTDGDASETPPKATNASVIQSKAASTCVTCHTEKASPASHGGHSEPEARIAKHANCTTSCHTEANVVGGIHPTCGTCHVAAGGAGPLKAPWETNNPTGGDCLACHRAANGPDYVNNFGAHVNPNHVNSSVAGLATTANCSSTNCHTAASADLVATSVHKTGCTACHVNITTNGTLRDGTTGKALTVHSVGVTSTCATCHQTGTLTYSTNFNSHVTPTHGRMVTSDNCSINCHVAANGDVISKTTVHTACTSCHKNMTLDGTLWNGPDGTITGKASVHTPGVNSSCVTCHGATASLTYDSDFTGAHKTVKHQNSALTDMLATTASCTANCHTAATAALIVSTTHKNNCLNCHTNTSTNGTLVNGAANAGSYGGTAQNRGSATNHTLGTASACASCHGATGGFSYDSQFAAAHIVKDHTGITFTVDTPIQSDDCDDCHNQTTAATIISTTHKNNCLNCHSNTTTDGRFVSGSANSGSYGGTGTNVGTATGHTLGSTNRCTTNCHITTYFSDTASPKHTVGTSNSGVHRVAIDGDTAGGQTCSTTGCHNNQSENWTNIRTRHDNSPTDTDVCHVCHDSVRNTNTVAGTVQAEIIQGKDRTIITSCLECHSNRSTAHGGHDAAQFPWTSLSPGTVGPSSCGRSGLYKTGFVNGFTCHDNTKAVIDTIHNGPRATALGSKCLLCHATTAGGDGNMRTYNSATQLGNANLGVGSNALHDNIQCITCHTKPKPELHHSLNTNARSGQCISCHMPRLGTQGNPIPTRNTVMMPANLACGWCHLWWPNNPNYMSNATDNGYNTTASGTGRVMMYKVNFDPITYQRQMAQTSTLASHAIATNAVQPIDDYGSCFACHGASGVDNGPGDAVGQPDMVKPYHGIGDPITTVVADTLAVGANNLPNRHLQNFIAGAQNTTSNGVEKMIPYHPGYGAFNLLATDVGLNQGGKTKPYATDASSHKFIHDAERTIRSWALRNTDLGTTSSNIEWNNYGPNLGAVGSITFNTGGVAGQKTKNTMVPLVPLNIPSNVKAR